MFEDLVVNIFHCLLFVKAFNVLLDLRDSIKHDIIAIDINSNLLAIRSLLLDIIATLSYIADILDL